MKIGLIFVLFAALAWAINSVIIRRISARVGEAFSATAVSIFIGLPFFSVVLFVTGEWFGLANVSRSAWVKLVLAGLIQNLFARFLNYSAIRLIGANKAAPLVATTPFFTVTFAVVFLNETLTTFLLLGVILIVAGAALIGIENQSVQQNQAEGDARSEIKGLLAALITALCYGITSVVIKSAITEIGSPYISVFIFYLASALGIAVTLMNEKRRKEMVHVVRHGMLVPLAIAGIITAIAGLLFQVVLSLSPVSLVSPLLSTNILMVFLISFFINRRLEVFTWKIFWGMLAVIGGVFFVFK